MPADWELSRPDWWERMQARESLLPDLPLDDAEAARAVGIFNRLRLPDVPGMPTLGEAAGEWFRDPLRAIFGSLDPATGLRHIPGVFLLVPKKNSKTTNGAALMITALLMNRRPMAAFAMFGPTQEIAAIAFDAAAGMIEADPDLKQLLHVQDHLKRITMRAGAGKGASLKITTFDPAVATGGKYAGWLLDEAHLLGRTSYAGRVLGQLRGARTAVPEQFGVIITTQSDERPAGMFAEELSYARGVRDGRIKGGRMLPLLYEFPEEVQRGETWRDPAIWPAVLPNLGRSVSAEVLTEDYAAAKEKGAAEERRWASQHLNVEIGLALHSDRWVGADYWEAAGEPALADLDELLARSEVCTVGIDGGGLDDLLGVAVIGRCRETRAWLIWAHAFAQPTVMQRRKEIAPLLMDFAAAGEVTICAPSASIYPQPKDVRGVVEIAERVRAAGLLPEQAGIGLDAAGVGVLIDELAGAGFTEADMKAVPQGWRLGGDLKTLERRLADGTARHGAQGLMAWSVSNMKIEPRANAVIVTKQASGWAKIDAAMAVLDAVHLMSRNPVATPVRTSYLASGGLVVL